MSTPEEKKKIAQEKFDKYDFDSDVNWRKFLECDLKGQLPPNANANVLLDVKKLWYKQVIDQDFDTGINLDDIPGCKSTDNNEEGKKEGEEGKEGGGGDDDNKEDEKDDKNVNPFQNASKTTIICFHIENLFKALFLVSTVYLVNFAHYLSLFIIIMALLRQLKRPRMNKTYGQKFVKNEFTHNLFYMVPFSLFYHARGVVYFLPLMTHYWIGLCEYLNINRGFLYDKAERLIVKTRSNKQRLLLLKAEMEIYMVGYQLFLILVWSFVSTEHFQQNILLMVFYVNFLRLKYMISINLQAAFYKINEWGVKTFANDNSNALVKWTYKKIQQFCIYLVTFDKKNKKK